MILFQSVYVIRFTEDVDTPEFVRDIECLKLWMKYMDGLKSPTVDYQHCPTYVVSDWRMRYTQEQQNVCVKGCIMAFRQYNRARRYLEKAKEDFENIRESRNLSRKEIAKLNGQTY